MVKNIYTGVTADAPMVSLLCSTLGLKTGLIANNVWNDLTGKELLAILRASKIASNIREDKDILTPMTWVTSDELGNRTWYSYMPGIVSELECVDLRMIRAAKLFYVDFYRVLRQVSLRAIAYARLNGIPTLVDLGGLAFAGRSKGSQKIEY